ncbi:UNVERIFIED_CONTAM: hypothetical protein RMT77_001456 [Armadillidium vulgare]
MEVIPGMVTLKITILKRWLVGLLIVLFFNILHSSKLLVHSPNTIVIATDTQAIILLPLIFTNFSDKLSDPKLNCFSPSYMNSTENIQNSLPYSILPTPTDMHTFKCHHLHLSYHVDLRSDYKIGFVLDLLLT